MRLLLGLVAAGARNLAVQPQLGIVIFDSTVPPGDGQAAYISATAGELAGDDIDTGKDVFARGAVAAGLATWTGRTSYRPVGTRVYRAVASEHFGLDEHDERVPVTTTPRCGQGRASHPESGMVARPRALPAAEFS